MADSYVQINYSLSLFDKNPDGESSTPGTVTIHSEGGTSI